MSTKGMIRLPGAYQKRRETLEQYFKWENWFNSAMITARTVDPETNARVRRTISRAVAARYRRFEYPLLVRTPVRANVERKLEEIEATGLFFLLLTTGVVYIS
jgi:hypothetical protein